MVRIRRGRVGSLGAAAALAVVLVPALALAVAHGPGDKGRPKPTPTATATATATAVPSPTPGAPSASPGAGAVGGHVSVGAVTLSIAEVPGSGEQGKPVQARVDVTSQSRATLFTILVGLRSQDLGVVIRPVRETTVKRLGPLASTAVTWTVCATGSGTRTVTVLATATTGGVTVSSRPYQVALVASRRC